MGRILQIVYIRAVCVCYRADDGSQFTHLVAQSRESAQRPQQPLLQRSRRVDT